ncbi:hypothetical protein ACFLZH_06100 [Patescibacteria group bacterium]
MSNETPSNVFLDQLRQNPFFQQLPHGLQQRYESLNIDNAVDLLKDLCLQAGIFLNRGNKQVAKTALELALEQSQFIGDSEKTAQIGAWLALIEDRDPQLVREVIDMIQEAVRKTQDFTAFEDQVLRSQ